MRDRAPACAYPHRASALAAKCVCRALAELRSIGGDGARLAALVKEGLETSCLEETERLEQIAELSTRLLCRNRARAAARAYGGALLGDKGGADAPEHAPLDAATRTLLPSYLRHTTSAAEDEASQMWVGKLFLADLPLSEGTSLCVRFSLSEHTGSEPAAEETPAAPALYDLSVQVLQVAPLVKPGGGRYALSWAYVDWRASDASEFALDDAARARLAELRAMLGLTNAKWTDVGMLGWILAALGTNAVEHVDAFAALLKACKDAHREELLASAGFF